MRIDSNNLLFLFFLFFLCLGQKVDASCDSSELLQSIKMPPGFRIEYYAQNVKGARSLALGNKGVVYVGTRNEGKVYALIDKDQNFKVDEVVVVAENLNSPNGVAYHQGDLYVAEINKILKFPSIDETYSSRPKAEVIYKDYPTDAAHGWKFIAFGPDQKLYVPVGAPCNICTSSNSVYASITRMRPDGSEMEIFAEGVRNTVGFDWHPDQKELWFTDNGRDWLGENRPSDELNKAPKKGLHFGYPFCHGNRDLDPKYGEGKKCENYQLPEQELGPHVAALGMRFYKGKMFPEKYLKQILIAEHGSWNREKKIGYRITLVGIKNGKATGYDTFAEGWLQANGKVCGRPVDLLELADGSMLISDDYGNNIYRITYKN